MSPVKTRITVKQNDYELNWLLSVNPQAYKRILTKIPMNKTKKANSPKFRWVMVMKH